MIVYDNLWRTIKNLNVTEERLTEQVGRSAIDRLKQNRPVSTRLIDKLCIFLHCLPADVMENKL